MTSERGGLAGDFVSHRSRRRANTEVDSAVSKGGVRKVSTMPRRPPCRRSLRPVFPRGHPVRIGHWAARIPAPSPAEALAAIIREEPEAVACQNPQGPPEPRWLIERCLTKASDDRYGSTGDLATWPAILSSFAPTGPNWRRVPEHRLDVQPRRIRADRASGKFARMDGRRPCSPERRGRSRSGSIRPPTGP